jgi:hypothetical protein
MKAMFWSVMAVLVFVQLVVAQQATCPTAQYAIAGAVENDKPAVTKVTLTIIGPATGGVEWQMDASLATGATFAVRAVSEYAPMTAPTGAGRFVRYLFRDSRGKVTEYRNSLTGKALLPQFHFAESFLPTYQRATPLLKGFAVSGQYIGHIATLGRVGEAQPPAEWKVDFTINLNPEMSVSILWPTKDDGTGQNKDHEYRYLPYSEQDFIDIIAAGCNTIGAPSAKDRSIIQDRSVFFFMAPQFPEDFYRSNYCGMDQFTDEPGIRMVFMGNIPAQANTHPAQVADFLVNRLRGMYGQEGTPYTLHHAVKALTPMGALDLRVDGIPCWETAYKMAFYEMAGGSGGIVHEGRYQRETEGWEPTSLFGPTLVIKPEQMLQCHNAVMRGAARAFGRHWGVSIYGQCNPKLRELALTVAYDMGAKWLWFWTADHDHHLPHAEKLRLIKAITEYAKAHPRRPLDELRDGAKTAIVFPYGYSFSFTGLWGNEAFDLGRLNRYGIPYREVVAAGAWEGILCATRGEDFDFTVEHDGLDKLGYRRIVRVGEDGVVTEWPIRVPTTQPSMTIGLTVSPAQPPKPAQPASYVLPCVPLFDRKPAIDGDLSDWKGPWLEMPGKQFAASGKWDGPDDLSGKIALGYDGANLYFAADVTDNIHSERFDGSEIWKGDCIQIGLDPLNTREKNVYPPSLQEFGFALRDNGQPATWRWFGQGRKPAGPLEGARVAIRRDEQSHHTFYEAAIPLELLGKLMPDALRYVGICVAMSDADGPDKTANAGSDRKSSIETSPGSMINAKDPSRFGSLEFLPFEGKRPTDAAARTMAQISPDNTTLAAGDAVRWGLRISTPAGKAVTMELRAELSSLSPAPPATAVATTRFDCRATAESREIVIPLEVVPGRYRLNLSALDEGHQLLAQESQTVFVYPRQ